MNLFRNFASATILMLVCIIGVFAQTQPVTSDEVNSKIFGDSKLLDKYTPLEDFLGSPDTSQVINATTYAFTPSTGVALEDMSSGTTQLVGATQDDTASAITNIGFDVWFDGVRYNQFSVNANGLLRLGSTVVGSSASGRTNDWATTTDNPKIAAYWDDLCTAANGKVHYKVTGAPGSRRLVVEWQNAVTFGTSCTTGLAIGTFQVWINESSSASLPGAIQFVYGALGANSTTNGGYGIGIGSSNTSFASVTQATDAVSYTVSDNAQTGAVAAGKSYRFTPNVPGAPTGLNFTSVTATTQQLNWTDNASNEVGYAIYRSTDGTNYSFVGQAAADATSFVDTVLLPSTNYFYQVYAVSEGALSSALSGSSMTSVPGNDSCSGAGGNWSSPGTWTDGSVPTASDNVTIGSGCTVTVDVTTAAAINLTINSGGTLQSPTTGTVTNNNLTVSGNVTNNGTLDFSTNGDTSGAILTFGAGAGNVSFSGTGATTDVRAITIAKGAQSTVVELNTGAFTVRGVNSDVAGYLTLTSGTFKISGTFALTNRTFTTATYTIPSIGGIWLNNPNYTVAATASGSTTINNGLLRVSQGTYNIGIGAGDQMRGGAGAVFNIEGGAVNVSGAFDPQSAVTYNQSGGTMNVGVVGNNVSNFGTFELFSTTSTFIMSGGTINIINPSTGTTKVDYRNAAPLATTNITGGTVVIGATGAPASSIYNVSGTMPSTTVNAAQTMRVNNAAVFMRGSTVTNNGTIDYTGASARYDFANQNGAMTYGGGGVFGTAAVPAAGVGISANGTGSTTLSAPIFVNRVNLFSGGFINSNQITLGSGAASTTVIQIGNSTTPTAAGTFDVSPVYNTGSGGHILLSLRSTTLNRPTGFEIPPSRSLVQWTVDTDAVGGTYTVAGGNITVTGALTLTNGIVATGANTLTHNGAATRTNGYVNGNLSRNFTATGTYTYHLGDGGYSPLLANVTAGTGTLTASAIDAVQPNIPTPSKAISRYWKLSGTGVTSDLTFTYTDADIPGTVTESSLAILKYDGAFSFPGGTVNTGANTATITGVTSFSDWTLAESGALTAPGVLALSSTTYAGAENSGNLVVTVNRTGGTDGAVTIDYALGGGTATGGAACGAGVDYVNTGGTVSFANGEGSKTFNVPFCGDTDGEPDETFNITLSNPTGGATLGSPSTATGTITNDDSLPAGNVIVNPGNAAYNTLKEAFDAINAGTHAGAVTVLINADTTETAPAVLNASGSGSANYTSVTVTPSGARTVSGAIAAGSPLIDLNGADNVTINGLNTGGNSLTISNTTASATANTSTIRFINDATSNTVTNSTVLGSSNMTVATAGGTILFSTGAATGNDNNTISNNNIGPAGANLPTKGVSGLGTTTAPANYNSGNSITGNNIYDFFGAAVASAGVYIAGGNTDWTVNNNRLYQTATRTQTTATIHAGIRVDSANNNNVTVNGNAIGSAAANGTGTYSFVGVAAASKFYPIHFSAVGLETASNVQGNTITNISVTGTGSGTSTGAPFAGILVSTVSGLVNIGNTAGNTIGSGTTAGAINVTLSATAASDVYGIYYFPSETAVISNNTVGGISAVNSSTGAIDLYGIRAFTASDVFNTMQNNQIGFAAAPLSVSASSNGSQVIGLYSQTGIGNVTGNTIRYLTIDSPNVGTTTTASIIGMWISGAAGTVISQNTIHTLSNTNATSAAVVVYGMLYSSATTGDNVVGRNFIHSFSLASTGAAVMRGILVTAGTSTFKNNMIRLGIDAAGASVTGGYDIAGIAETGGSNNYYHNSVYIGGSAGTTAVNSFAFSSTVATGTRNVVNNIFANARTITGGGGGNFAAQYGGTLPLPAGLNANGNIYHSADEATTIRNGTTAYTLAAWRSASGSQDSASIFASLAQINFVNPTGTSATVDLHVQGSTLAERNGIPVASVTDDFDGQTRASLTPVDIGADAGDFTFTDVAPPAISFTPLGNTGNFNNRVLTVTISDGTGVASGANSPRIYFRKSTGGAYVSTQCVMTGGTPQNGTYDCTIDYTLIGGVVGGETIQYFVIAQDTVGNIASNAGGAVATNVNNVTAPPANPYSYFVFQPFGATVNVGTGQTYTSLTNPNGLFDVLNQIGLAGSLTVNITSDLTAETGAVPLNQIAEQGAGGYTLTIKPSGAARTISGTSASNSALITLNGADRVVFDGSLSGGTDRSLTITNNQPTTTAVFWIRSASASNGSNNNTIKNCIVNGATGATATTTVGVLTGSGVTLGNDAEAPNSNNTLQNNWVYRVQNSFYLRGGATAPVFDQNWTVTGNEMGSIASTADKNTFRGMLIGNSANFTISGNTVHGVQSSSTSTSAMSGIQLGLLLSNGTVTNNQISDIKNISTTGIGAHGISIIATSTNSNVTIANNFVWDIAAQGSATVASNGHGIAFLSASAGSGFNLYFNSVNLNTNQPTAQTTAALFVIGTFNGAGAINARNNIFANTQTTGTRYAVYSLAPANVFSAIDYNDYFAQSVGFIGGSTRTTLTDWQAATGGDANSKAVDPLFVSPTNLHLQPTSPLLAMGVSGTGITTDIDGQTRDTPPDIGADEIPAAATPGTVQFSAPTYSVSEAGGTVTLTVTRTSGSAGAISVNYATANGTATGGGSCAAGIDYVTANGTLNWADGDTASKTFNVTICNDAAFEADETFTATLSGATGGATIGTPNPATVTITNDDPAPAGTFSVNDVRVLEGNAGGANAVFTVTYTGAAPGSVQYATANGTALAGVDYLAASGTLNFASSGTQAVSVPIIGKSLKEANETFFLNLSNPTGATITDGQGVGIIVDEDRSYPADFDRDWYSDLSIFRPSEGNWYIFNSSDSTSHIVQFGIGTDRPVPGDYNGDGKTDLAVFRPGDGTWFVAFTGSTTVQTTNWGTAGDKPVQGDYDGDGKTDIAIYRPSTGTWWIIRSSDSSTYTVPFGVASDLPMQGDYDGDFKTDQAVYRNGTWYVLLSSNASVVTQTFGLASDKPVSGDFDGDGKYDLAVFRNGTWWVFNSLTATPGAFAWGTTGDIPVPADYDRDGTTDFAVFRPSTGQWFVYRSSNGSYFALVWGANGDIPIPSALLPQ